MTTEIEKTFFDTFGIEPITHAVWDSTETKWKNFESWEDYPQITDRILLGIIAKIMWSYSCTQNDFDAYEVHTVDNLKEAVLRHAIELSKNDAYVYWGVRTLFEEG